MGYPRGERDSKHNRLQNVYNLKPSPPAIKKNNNDGDDGVRVHGVPERNRPAQQVLWRESVVHTGHLWDYMCHHDLAVDPLRRVRGYERDTAAHDVPHLQRDKHRLVSNVRITGVRLASTYHVHGSGECLIRI